MEGYLELSLEELYNLEELDLLFQDKRFAEIVLAVTTHPFNPEYAASVVHPGFQELNPNSDLMNAIRYTARGILAERKGLIAKDLESVVKSVEQHFVSKAQLKCKSREVNTFTTIDEYLMDLCRKHLPVELRRDIGERDPNLWRAIDDYRQPQKKPSNETEQTITMHPYFKGFGDGKSVRPVYLLVHRLKRDVRIAQKIARETEKAAEQREKDKKNGNVRTAQEYLGEAVIEDIPGFSIITPNRDSVDGIKEKLPTYFEVVEIKDYYQEQREGSLPDYRAIHALIRIPRASLQPDPVRLHITTLEDHLNSAIGIANRKIYVAREGAERGKLYLNLVGQITELLT